MARYKVQPTCLKTQVQAPYFIIEIGDYANVEKEATDSSYLCTKYPERWVVSVTKLQSIAPNYFRK